MLGLTDRYIARCPEKIEGIPASWKERKYNTSYVLSCEPDFIIFSTGYKPCAPAERALFLHSAFRKNYHHICFPREELLGCVFRKKGPLKEKDRVFENPQFVNLYNYAANLNSRGDYQEATRWFEQVIRMAPDDFSWVYGEVGINYFFFGDDTRAKEYLTKAIEIDPLSFRARYYLIFIYHDEKRYEDAWEQVEKIYPYNPGLVEKEKEYFEMKLSTMKNKEDSTKSESGKQ